MKSYYLSIAEVLDAVTVQVHVFRPVIDEVKLEPNLTTSTMDHSLSRILPVTKGNHDIRVVLRIIDPTKDANAGVRIHARTDPWVDVCFTRHLCLDKLGDASQAFVVAL